MAKPSEEQQALIERAQRHYQLAADTLAESLKTEQPGLLALAQTYANTADEAMYDLSNSEDHKLPSVQQ